MSSCGRKASDTPKTVAPAPTTESKPHPSMKANEKLVGRALIDSGAVKDED